MSEQATYDLLTEKWIPVVFLKGTSELLNIRDVLVCSSIIKGISHTSPFIEFGLYRLLITIVLDAYIVAGKRPTIGKMKEMLAAKQFDQAILMDYLDKYKEGFNLWSQTNPFLQIANPIKEKGKVSADPIEKMIAPIPSGTKVAFWHHYGTDEKKGETTLTWVETSHELCAVAPFCFDYAPSDICTIAGDPPLYALALGNSLFKTLVYNLPRPNGRLSKASEVKDGPTWRCIVTKPDEVPRSPTHSQAWTWPVRQIKLQKSENEDKSTVSNAVNLAGSGKTDARKRVHGWRDPNAGTVTDGEALRHIRGRDGMLLWRDFVPLYLVGSEGEALRGDKRRSRPEVVTNALRLVDQELFRVAVYGFIDKGGRNNKVFRTWIRSVLTFPTEVGRDSRLSSQAFEAFKNTQRVAKALEESLRLLKPPVKASKDKRPPPGRCDSDVIASFWQELEPKLAHDYLDGLGKGDASALQTLNREVKTQARRAFKGASDPHRQAADGLYRIANASNYLERRLAQLVPKEKNS